MGGKDAAKWEMIEAGGRTAQSFGLSRLLGQIYILLYLSHEALSLDALVQTLGVSKASVSIACRQLESWGAVRRIWVKGDRRDFYEAETDFRVLVQNGLMPSLQKKLDSARRQIDRSLQLLDEDTDKGDEKGFLRRRLLEAEGRRARIQRLLNNPVMRRLL